MCSGKIKTAKIIFANRNTHIKSKIQTANAVQQFRWHMQDGDSCNKRGNYIGHNLVYLNQILIIHIWDKKNTYKRIHTYYLQ